MDNSMDIDVLSQDTIIKNTTENVNNLSISDNTEKPEQPDDDDEFNNDMDLFDDINEEDIKTLMSPQSEKIVNLSTETNSTNLNFNSQSKSSFSSSNKNAQMSNMSIEDTIFNNNIKIYYKNLFPIKQYYRWLSYGNVDTEYFSHREFSFTLYPETYLRYQSFIGEQEFKTQLEHYFPKKIDIGAVYNSQPINKKRIAASAFKPVEKELVFDIDMTDYDDIRTCCSGGNICNKCWTFMTISIKIIDTALREDFGFNNILWVYSGRRGVHCWVCDSRARKLNENARRAIAGYLDIMKGGEQKSRKVYLPNILHPSLQRSYNIVKEYFPKLILEDMNIFGSEESYNKLLSTIPEEDVRNKLSSSWKNSLKSPQDKWQELVDEIQRKAQELNKKKKYEREKELKTFERDIIFQYTYPRLDINVSLHLNHLLKSPFCIHPGTGRVCVPIDPKHCDDFDPFKVPTLNELCKEIEEIQAQGDSLKHRDLQKSTSIAPYIDQLSDFLKSLDPEISKERRMKMEINEMNGEW